MERLLLLICLTSVSAYSRVATNGQARSASRDVSFTVSPIYVATPKSVDGLRPGEALDHPSTAKYSTLDEEMVAKLDGLAGRSRAQDRFHPPSKFEHVLAHSNALKQSGGSPLSGSDSNDDVIYTKPIVSMTYDYPPTSYETNPASKPQDSFPIYSPSKLPDTYSSGPSDNSPSISEYDSKPSTFDLNHPPKSLDFPAHFDDLPSYIQPQEVIYDHIPEDHYHHHHHHRPVTSTEEPEMMDQRLNKRPYSYYYIGKKLWYVPLYFSIYFIIYIAALVLKSIARHKINFPANLADAVQNARSSEGHTWRDYLEMVLEGIEKYGRMP